MFSDSGETCLRMILAPEKEALLIEISGIGRAVDFEDNVNLLAHIMGVQLFSRSQTIELLLHIEAINRRVDISEKISGIREIDVACSHNDEEKASNREINVVFVTWLGNFQLESEKALSGQGMSVVHWASTTLWDGILKNEAL